MLPFLLGLVLSLPLCFMRTFIIFYAILHTLVRPFYLSFVTSGNPLPFSAQLQLRPSQSFLFDPRHPPSALPPALRVNCAS
ncbi:hypothetical protein BJ322DRAFT_1062907 [Thelephora terrestris]|uniref:Uncharacterized protein n=1 Tax=Thelephora terrestris TaxID=56493 RepID=A0A9P6L7A7_9AGAM|nr:hypothetical protein BJ322DRAFT_1062907 [Thelephora terrestris]